MSISTHVIGIKSDTNPEYQKHCKILQKCIEDGEEYLPKESQKFFNTFCVDEDLFEEALKVKIKASDYDKTEYFGLEIKVKDIPPDVETIRFSVSF